MRGIIAKSIGDEVGGCADLSKSGELGYTAAYTVIRDYCN